MEEKKSTDTTAGENELKQSEVTGVQSASPTLTDTTASTPSPTESTPEPAVVSATETPSVTSAPDSPEEALPATEVAEEVALETPPEAAPIETSDTEVAAVSTETPTTGGAWKQYAIAAVVLVVMGGGLMFALEQQGRLNLGLTSFFSSWQSEKPVARINGVAVTKAQYDQNFTQISRSAQQQGADISDSEVQAEIQNQALEVLINTELLRQAAAEADIAADEAAIDERYSEIVATIGGEAELMARMTELGITPESLRNDIEGELLVQQLIATQVDTTGVEILDEDVIAVYEQAGGAAGGLPPLAEVREQIEQQLRFTAEQELVADYIESLRANADVEVLI